MMFSHRFAAVQSLSHVRLLVTPLTTACQAPLSFTISQSLLKFMSTELVMLSISSSVAPFFFCLQYFPASGSFPMSQLFSSGGQSIGASASAPVLPMNIQGWFPLGLIGLISLLPKGLSIQLWHPSTTIQKNQLFLASSITRLSRPEMTTGKNIAWPHGPLSAMQCLFLIPCLGLSQRSKPLLISWLQSPSAVIWESKKRKYVTVSTFFRFICQEVLMILVFRMLNVEL